LPNPTVFEREKTVTLDHLHNILNIVENYNDQVKTITTDIPANSDYSKLNQYASFDQWGLSYDKKGNTTQRGTQQLAYDYRNQLVTAVDAPSNTQVEMRYDVLGRRTQKSVTIGSQTKIENYYHSGHQVIEVRDGNDQLLRQYIYGNGIDEVIRMDKYEGDTFTSYYYHTDASGSVTAITDANGQLVERVTYDIYGMPTFWDAAGNKIPKSSIGNNILFQGREYDEELNLYYFRARYYCPIMGRFLQTDPMGYHDAMNLYQAFGMNPINFTDPFGDAVMPGVDPAVVMSAYIQFIQSGDSPDTALRKLEEYGYIDSEDSYKLALVASAHVEPGAQILGTTAYIMFEFSPAGVFKDAVSLPFGKDLVSGEKLKWWQKALIATPFVLKGIEKGRKILNALSEGIEGSRDLTKSTINTLTKDEMADVVGASNKNTTKSVYRSVEESGNVEYIGITKNLESRAAQHLRSKGIRIRAIPGVRNLSAADARAVEQVLIELHGLKKQGGTLINKINSIAKSNPIYAESLRRGVEILKKINYEGI